MSSSFRSETRGMSQLASLGILLGSAVVLALALGLFIFINGA
ncbi:hypothetical protein [Natronomonas pharaonis]|nr:hypothetical protein [Natronomonas pharaonis]